MAAPSIVGVGAVAASVTPTGITPVIPTHQTNDILLGVFESGDPAGITAPSGWAHVTGSPQPQGVGTNPTCISVIWKRAASASETNPTIASTANHQVGGILVVRGCIETGNPWNYTPAVGGATQAATFSNVGGTTTVADCLAIFAVAGHADSNADQFSSVTNATLTGFAEADQYPTNLGNGGCAGVWSGTKAAPGSVGTTGGNCVGSLSAVAWINFALLPVPNFASLAGAIGAVTGAFTATVTTNDSSLAGTIPAVTGSVSLLVGASATPMSLAGNVQSVTGAFTVAVQMASSLAGTIPAVTGAFNLDKGEGLTLAGSIPAVTGALRVSTISRAAAVAADGPLVWLRLDDASGSTATDSSGNGNDGTIVGTLGWGHSSLVPTDPGNDAATFASDRITVPLTGGDELTIEGVVADVGSTSCTLARRDGYFTILDFGVGTNVRRIQAFNARAGMVTTVSLDYNSGAGIIHAWAASFTETDTVLYVREATVGGPGEFDSDSGTFATSPPNPNSALIIGETTPSGILMSGVQDELAYYDYALTREQMQRHADLGHVLEPVATLAGTIPVTFAASITKTDFVSLAGTIARVTSAVTVTTPLLVQLAGNIPAVTGAFALDIVASVSLAGSIAPVTGALTVKHGEVSLAGIQQGVQGSFTVLRQEGATLAGTIGAVTGVFALTGAFEIALTGQVPRLTASFVFGFPPQTEIGNRASGRLRDGFGVVFYEPPVVEPPEFTIAAHAFVSVRAYAGVTMVGAQPTFSDVAKTQARRALDRVVVGGRDVTYYRGVVTPPPSYGLVVPLLYGAATLDLPQVSATFEQPGVGDLSWCRKGAKVLVQRVDPDTLEVLATDYKGIVIAHNINGRHLQLQIGGEATGRAALIDKQPPLFFKRNDLGFWHWGGINDLGLRFEPRLGIDTGIRLRNAGGTDHLSYLQELSAKGTRRNGTQYTIMPDAHEDGGAYRTVEKDTETIHATVYLDDAVTVPDLRDDLAEQPNRAFATGVTPEGMRVKFGAYPVLRDDTPPPYPMSDDSHFGIGTVDADTDTGDGVSVMIWRLVKAGFLALADKPGGFDDEVADAIKDLKQDASSGFAVIDGDMTPAAWLALFDASATGYSLAGTQILPAAQRPATRKWNRTANGSVIGRNDNFDPTIIPVDTTLDAGVGMTRKQIRGFARGELATVGGSDFVGTVTLNSGAVIRGDHTPGDPITEADVMDARELRPGMNLSAPLFAGGRTLHVAGVERRVSEEGVTTVILDVDTQARDTMKVWEVIRRNRDSRRNPARAWLQSHRSSALAKDSVVEFDEIGGVLDDRVDLAGGAWTVFPVVAGQEGTIRSLRLETQPAVEFAVSVFGRQISASRLNELVGDPMAPESSERWTDVDARRHLDEDYILLYSAGGDTEFEEPCGYFPGKKSAGFAEVTGRWEDDASFSYHTFGSPVLWVAVWAVEATHLRPGRIMWPQLEAGS